MSLTPLYIHVHVQSSAIPWVTIKPVGTELALVPPVERVTLTLARGAVGELPVPTAGQLDHLTWVRGRKHVLPNHNTRNQLYKLFKAALSNRLASFPGSTPQLFATVLEKLGSGACERGYNRSGQARCRRWRI